MRRFWGLLLVAAGVFALVLGVFVKFYVEPRVVRAGLDENSFTRSVSDGQSVVLDQGTGVVNKGLTLTANREVRGIVDGSKDDSVAVWHTANSLLAPGGTPVNVDDEVIAFDRRSGLAVNCCGEQLNGDTTVRHSGLFFKFPFGATTVSQPYWDTTAKRAFPAAYVATEKRGDLEVYHYRQTIPATPLTTGPVPPSYVGLTGDQPVQLTTMYSNIRDLWVEPVTGEIVDGHEQPKQTLVDADGKELLVAFHTSIGYTQATVDAAVQRASTDASKVRLVSTVLPLVLVVLAPILLIAGLLLLLAADRRSAVPEADGRAARGGRRRETVDLRDPATVPAGHDAADHSADDSAEQATDLVDLTGADADPLLPGEPRPGPA